MLLIRAKQLAYLIGFSEAHAHKIIHKLKKENNLSYKETAISIELVCKYYNIPIEQAQKRLGIFS